MSLIAKNLSKCSKYPPCDQSFRKHNTLQKHVTSVHLGKKPFPCPHLDPRTSLPCTWAFDTNGRLKSHQRRVHGEHRFWCTNCSSSAADGEEGSAVGFSSYAEFQDHMKHVHPPQCLDCGHICISQRDLRQHLEIAHGVINDSANTVHRCGVDGCGKAFTKKYNLTLHKRNVHEGERRFVCGQFEPAKMKGVDGWDNLNACSMAFTSKGNLEEHVRTQHLGLPGKPKLRREAARGQQSSRSETNPGPNPIISALTGIGYGETSHRSIPCMMEGCEYRLTRLYDLKTHLRSFHNVSEATARDILSDHNVEEHPATWDPTDLLSIFGPEMKIAGMEED